MNHLNGYHIVVVVAVVGIKSIIMVSVGEALGGHEQIGRRRVGLDGMRSLL